MVAVLPEREWQGVHQIQPFASSLLGAQRSTHPHMDIQNLSGNAWFSAALLQAMISFNALRSQKSAKTRKTEEKHRQGMLDRVFFFVLKRHWFSAAHPQPITSDRRQAMLTPVPSLFLLLRRRSMPLRCRHADLFDLTWAAATILVRRAPPHRRPRSSQQRRKPWRKVPQLDSRGRASRTAIRATWVPRVSRLRRRASAGTERADRIDLRHRERVRRDRARRK
jgi:hypothetical protein